MNRHRFFPSLTDYVTGQTFLPFHDRYDSEEAKINITGIADRNFRLLRIKVFMSLYIITGQNFLFQLL